MTRARPWPLRLALACGLVVAASVAASCSARESSGPGTTSTTVGTSDTSAAGDTEEIACGPVVEEPLDASYLVHVVGDGEDIQYTSDPPTSGPHKAGPAIDGVVDRSLTRPVQVGILERGDILVQHRPDLAPALQAELATLAGPGVVIAPNPDLPAPVVATAWTHKRTCQAMDLDALRGFIDARRGKGPGD